MPSYVTEVLGEETNEPCTCCGRPVFEGEGLLHIAGREIAHYGYRYSEGHQSRFTLGICPLDERGEPIVGLAVVQCRSNGENLIYTVLDPGDSPWGDTEALGKVLTREQLLGEEVVPELFELVGAIAAREARIASRILAENAF